MDLLKEHYTDIEKNFISLTNYCLKIQEQKETCLECVIELTEEEAFVGYAHCEKYFYFNHLKSIIINV